MRNRVRGLVAVAAATVLVLSGPVPGQAAPDQPGGSSLRPAAEPSAPQARYDGETIFRGLFLGMGPLTAQHPELTSRIVTVENTPEAKAAWAATSDRIVAAVRRADASFFDTFGEAMTSGDRVRVDQALRSGQELLITVLEEEFGASAGSDDGRGIGSFVFGPVAIAAAAVAVVVYAVWNAAAVATVAAYVETAGSVPVDGETAIDHERWVDQVAGALAG